MKRIILLLMVSMLLIACSSQPETTTDPASTMPDEVETTAPAEPITPEPTAPEEPKIPCESFGDCPGDMDCTDDFCTGPDCGECQYEEDKACFYYSCCSDEDCRDWETCIDHECYEEGEEPEETEPEIYEEVEPEEVMETEKEPETFTDEFAECPDIDCFHTNAQDCTASKTTATTTINFFGMEQTTTTDMEFYPSGSKCKYSQVAKSMEIKFSKEKKEELRSEGTSEDDINQQESDANTAAQAAVGITRTCVFNTPDLYDTVGRWAEEKYSTSDWKVGDCE
ncbi:hypothetical protein ACFL0V_00380 [Nanoarchaeota archaeon]